ncbi:TlpA disulfide reductase family protein [Gorillibacterium sp. CAU 1737]|uniref:TlpA family protein disulfide reductase n=1 Tax=Gorillibacterium sp. CAU 1737 TaxID=3140362 RepID=UPI003261CCAB
MNRYGQQVMLAFLIGAVSTTGFGFLGDQLVRAERSAVYDGEAERHRSEEKSPSGAAAFAEIEPAEPGVGVLAPELDLPSLKGGEQHVGGKRKKPLLLTFWASTCPPCEEEAPLLASLYARHRDKLDVLAVNVTLQDSRKAAASFAAKNGFTFPVLLDEQGEATRLYGLRGLPTTFLIDKEGRVREFFYAVDSDVWEQKVQQLLTD